jgi:hypothetical protein
VVMSARDEFPINGGGEPLLDLVCLGVIHECGNGDRAYVRGQGDGVAGSMVAAAGKETEHK